MPLTINKTSINSKKISVLISQDGFSFYEKAATSKLLGNLEFKHKLNPIEILAQLELYLSDNKYLVDSFTDVTVIYDHDLYGLVPATLFKEENAADYLKYNARILKTDVIASDPVTAHELQCVYIPYMNINNYMYEKYGSFNYQHLSSFLLESLPISPDAQFYVTLRKDHFYITAFSNNALLLHNSFTHQDINDVLYYVMFTLEQLKLSPETVQVTLIAKEQIDKLHDLLFTYIREVHWGTNHLKSIDSLLCV